MTDRKKGLVKHKSVVKSNNYACQICRAPHEICQRCAKQAALLTTAAPPPTARRGRPRATLSSYR